MDPSVGTFSEENDKLGFTLSGVNVSIANGLRRVIIAEIPAFVFRTTPHKQNKINIIENTSRMHNEIIKQRLSCIPIHIDDMNFDYTQHEVEVSKSNDTDSIMFVTSQDIKIKNINTGSYLSEKTRDEIFPPDKITGDYIDIVRLRPKLSETIMGEKFAMTGKFDIGTAKEDAAFNVASTATYKATQNILQANKEWLNKLKTLEGNIDIETEMKDWMLLEGKKIIIPDSFDFLIETVGIYTNKALLQKACHVIIQKANNFLQELKTNEELINISKNTMENSYDITLEGEDYTLGKVLEYILYQKFFTTEKVLTFCGFLKPHPHINTSLIRIAFASPTTKGETILVLTDVVSIITNIYESISKEFMELN